MNSFIFPSLFLTNEQENLINSEMIRIKEELNIHIKNLDNNLGLNQISQSLNQLFMEERKERNEQQMIKLPRELNNTFNFQLMQQSFYQYQKNEQCFAIAFNSNASVMIATCNNLIKVFEFEDDKPQQIQQLNMHNENVTCLEFMKKSNQFVSASYDQTIIIWQQGFYNLWQSTQVLKEHKSCIYCITINQNEDSLFSGGSDKKIVFWKKQGIVWNVFQTINLKGSIFSLSLNNSEDKLIASVTQDKMIVMQLKDKLKVIQTIKFDDFGYRLCFIDANEICYQSMGRHLQIFHYNPLSQFFSKGYKVKYLDIGCNDFFFFPIRYISQIGLLMVKSQKYIHLIMRDQNNEFKVAQSIKFDTNHIFGNISNDGRYIATWDSESRKIQIRELVF